MLILFSGSRAAAEEYTFHTQEEALAWVRDLLEHQWGTRDNTPDYDRTNFYYSYDKGIPVGEPQCVDLTKAYCDYLIGYNCRGYAKDYEWLEIHPDWIRDSQPRPGDIAVSVGKGYGHVAVILEVIGDQIIYADTNGDSGAQHQDGEGRWINAPLTLREGSASSFQYYIHPLFLPPEEQGPARYTVLVLDASGTETFNDNYANVSFTSNSSIEEVKAAASRFLEDVVHYADKNYIALVSYEEEARVISDFTDDIDALKSALSSVRSNGESSRSIEAGLAAAEGLLNGIKNEEAIRSLVLCTTGMTDAGASDYSGFYNSNTIASDWRNEATNIKLYAYANEAIRRADQIKKTGTDLYVIGLFSPVEDRMKNTTAIYEVASFLRLTARDLASGTDKFYEVEDVDTLEFVFGQVQEEVAGDTAIKLYNKGDWYLNNDRKDDRGYYEWIYWGEKLFCFPATRLFEADYESDQSPARNLSLLSASLSADAYHPELLTEELQKLGFKDKDIYLYSYPGDSHNRNQARRGDSYFAKDGDLAFSIASQAMEIRGEETDVLFILARGTAEKMELIKDATTLPSKSFFDYTAWDWVYEFEEDIMAGLRDYLSEPSHASLGKRPIKILVTGHSLGGAAANLVAARLNYQCQGREDKLFESLKQEDVYGFTYGAIDSVFEGGFYFGLDRTSMPVKSGFENIVNIYNLLDNFGPYSTGVAGITARGNTGYSKYGYMLLFANKMDKYVKPAIVWVDGSLYNRHEISGYIQAVHHNLPHSYYTMRKKRVYIHCPVDVMIMSEGEAVCFIQDNQIEYISKDCLAVVDEDRKTILLPEDKEYVIQLTATAEGSMDYYIQSISGEFGRTDQVLDVKLAPGKKMQGIIPSELPEREEKQDGPELYVFDDAGQAVSRLVPDGSEVVLRIAGAEPEESVRSEEASETVPLWLPIASLGLGLLIDLVALVLVVVRLKER